jgi:glycosyltransferase involved in cell wall biosynthesis
MFLYLGIILIVAFAAVMYPYIRHQYRKFIDSLSPKDSNKKPKAHLVWVMHSYVPTVRAGSEITTHALNKYLVAAGYKVSVFVRDYKVPEYEGVDIYKLSDKPENLPEYAREIFESANAIGCQNFNGYDGLVWAEHFNKPIIFFLHIEFEKIDMLQQKFKVPVHIVYNSLTQKEALPTIHNCCIVKPHIDYKHFREFKKERPQFITLLNCNKNKGGNTLIKLATMMPEHQFMGVQGAYQKQVRGNLANLHYMGIQEDPRIIYAKSSAIIMPSKAESWGRVALEAMAMGVPVIVGDTPGLREATGGKAVVCHQTDIDCWMREVKNAVTPGPEREGMIAAGLKRVAELEKETDFEDFDRWFIQYFSAV